MTSDSHVSRWLRLDERRTRLAQRYALITPSVPGATARPASPTIRTSRRFTGGWARCCGLHPVRMKALHGYIHRRRRSRPRDRNRGRPGKLFRRGPDTSCSTTKAAGPLSRRFPAGKRAGGANASGERVPDRATSKRAAAVGRRPPCEPPPRSPTSARRVPGPRRTEDLPACRCRRRPSPSGGVEVCEAACWVAFRPAVLPVLRNLRG